jgi:hypothetical protein
MLQMPKDYKPNAHDALRRNAEAYAETVHGKSERVTRLNVTLTNSQVDSLVKDRRNNGTIQQQYISRL